MKYFTSIMKQILCVYCLLAQDKLMAKNSRGFAFDCVFFEMAPYMYTKNGTYHGIIFEMFQKYEYGCNLTFKLKYDVKTIQNFTKILKNTSKSVDFLNKKTLWFPLTHVVDKDDAETNNLTIISPMATQGIEVVMHRHQISLLVKIWQGLVDCRHLTVLALILTVCFGILIWIAVSMG